MAYTDANREEIMRALKGIQEGSISRLLNKHWERKPEGNAESLSGDINDVIGELEGIKRWIWK